MSSETSSASSDTAFLFGLKSSSESSSSFLLLLLPTAKLRRCCARCCESTDQALQLAAAEAAAGSTSRRSSGWSCGAGTAEASERRPEEAAATRAERATARSIPWRAEHEDNAITFGLLRGSAVGTAAPSWGALAQRLPAIRGGVECIHVFSLSGGVPKRAPRCPPRCPRRA